jgi:hypothetical protein
MNPLCLVKMTSTRAEVDMIILKMSIISIRSWIWGRLMKMINSTFCWIRTLEKLMTSEMNRLLIKSLREQLFDLPVIL